MKLILLEQYMHRKGHEYRLHGASSLIIVQCLLVGYIRQAKAK